MRLGQKAVLGQRPVFVGEVVDSVDRDAELPGVEDLDQALLLQIPEREVEVLPRDAQHLLEVYGTQAAQLRVLAPRGVEQ